MKNNMHVITHCCLLLIIWVNTLNLASDEESDDVRLVGGSSHCSGTLQMKHQGEWRPVVSDYWNTEASNAVCRLLDCGSAVSKQTSSAENYQHVWRIHRFPCDGNHKSLLTECSTMDFKMVSDTDNDRLDVICSESVRLVNGTSLCSGRVEVKSDQSWVSVCEGDFDRQDAEVVCRELGCGAPSVLQGALYGEGKAPLWTKGFQCEGSESVLLDCGTTDSTRNTCSSNRVIGLTCSESYDVRLVGGSSHCSGTLQMKHQGEWRLAESKNWNLDASNVVCKQLDCGSAVSIHKTYAFKSKHVWRIGSPCGGTESSLTECGIESYKPDITGTERLGVICSESVSLVNGTSLCSGRVEVKSDQSWVSVCEGDFDQQDAEVVCRQLGCGPPSVLQGALYGEGKLPMWTKEFQCEGNESVLLNCRTSDLIKNICSSDMATGLTCSEDDVRLVDGSSHCSGTLQMKHQREWRPVVSDYWNQEASTVLCRQLHCGSAVSTQTSYASSYKYVWRIGSPCNGTESSLTECGIEGYPETITARLDVICSESVRLVNGTSLCSGRVEVKSDRSWVSVCEGDFDQQDAEVVCRELGCGAPSVLQGALYGRVKAPMWTKEFQCEGSESVLLDCRTSDSRNTCSPDKAVGLTCSELKHVRLVGGTNHCTGRMEIKHRGEWRLADDDHWNLKSSAVLCRQLDCGSAVSYKFNCVSRDPAWNITSSCNGSESSLWDCMKQESDHYYMSYTSYALEVICSGNESVLIDSTMTTFSPDKSVGLICSDPRDVSLVGGTSHCNGVVMIHHEGDYRPVDGKAKWNLRASALVCRQLDCGSVVSRERGYFHIENRYYKSSIHMTLSCVGSESSLTECATVASDGDRSRSRLQVTCSESVRLVNGTSLCSGRVEVKSDQSWVSVCEGDFDQQDAEVVCRELGCGAPSVLQGALYGGVNAPMFTKEFQCEGSESVLQDCRTSDSTRNTCSPDKAVGLTCSEPDTVRLVGGTSRCSGTLEIKQQQEWRPAQVRSEWNLKTSAVVCRQLDCGSVVSTGRFDTSSGHSWQITAPCEGSDYSLRECVSAQDGYGPERLKVICSESVRLVNGTSLCSGRVEVKSDQSWVSVCEGDFDQQDAEVVCRELGCGPPLVVQGALYGDVKAQMWTKEFQCEGSEAVLMDCGTSDSRNAFSPDKAVGLTCSDSGHVRLVGGTSQCTGRLEMQHQGKWRPIYYSHLKHNSAAITAAVVCRQLDCGSAVSVERHSDPVRPHRPVWRISSLCDGSESSLRECGTAISDTAPFSDELLKVTCSESVRLVNGNSVCSGRVEVKSDQSWVSVCEGDFDQQDAEVVCRQLGCGSPSVLQGALYGEGKAPMWTKEFQCEGSESVLMDCRTSDSTRNTCSPDKAVGLTCSESVRLVGGTSHCTGTLEMKHQGEWRPVYGWPSWNQKTAAVVCRQLDCGTVVSAKEPLGVVQLPVWEMTFSCDGSESSLSECGGTKGLRSTGRRLQVTCSESVRLVNGTSLCSGRVEVKSDQSWVSVCEGDFDQQDAEVVCRELGCGAPSVLQGALYGKVNDPVFTKEFQCEGSESVLLDCRTSDSTRNTCSPDKAVGLTCSEPDTVRLVGGTSRCSGTLEVKQRREWRPAKVRSEWNLKTSALVCRQLDCGSVVSTGRFDASWQITTPFEGSDAPFEGSDAQGDYSTERLKVICSESVRLVNGTSLCSGRVEVKSDQSWVSVCEGDFDQQDAEVVCRELGCGPPLVLQGALYGDVKAQMWTEEFQCEGSEAVLMDCRTSDSSNTCSPDKAVGLTCSDSGHVRLVGGTSQCTGRLEMQHQGEWRPIYYSYLNANSAAVTAAVVCRQLDCGSAVSVERHFDPEIAPVWQISSHCDGSESSLRDCGTAKSDSTPFSPKKLELICSESVRLVNGTSLCSGRVEVKSDQSWVSVCEGDFDQQDAEVVCRELGYGPPSVLQGALYGEGKAPLWTKEFQCEGSESVLLDCRTSDSTRNTCSPDKAVGLTCSESDAVRLVGGTSHCTGTLEMKHQGEWRPVDGWPWNQKTAAVVCRQLDCGTVVSAKEPPGVVQLPVWEMTFSCNGSESSLSECGGTKRLHSTRSRLQVTCSGNLGTHRQMKNSALSVVLSH